MLDNIIVVLLIAYFLGCYVSAIALGYVVMPIEISGYVLVAFIVVKEVAKWYSQAK